MHLPIIHHWSCPSVMDTVMYCSDPLAMKDLSPPVLGVLIASRGQFLQGLFQLYTVALHQVMTLPRAAHIQRLMDVWL